MADWRPMLASDVAAVHALSQAVAPGEPASRAVFAEKRKRLQSGCFVLGAASALQGYGFSHAPEPGDALVVHDVALHEDVRGTGKIVELLRLFEYVARARGLARIALVSARAMQAYWERAAFEVSADAAVQREVRAFHGDDAVSMVRELPA